MRVILPLSLSLVAAISTLATAADTLTPGSASKPQPTFTKDVAPLLQNRCQVCHRPDTFAPMSLLTYEEARPWAKSIKQKVLAREMPPWYIDKNVGVHHFKNDVSLSDEEIATIVKWVDAGAPKGNPADMPRPRKFDDSDQVALRSAGSDRHSSRKISWSPPAGPTAGWTCWSTPA